MRNIEALDSLPMYKFNRETQDFRLLEVAWAGDVFYSMLNPSEEGRVSREDGDDGFTGGWLQSDLRTFFQGTNVEFPKIEDIDHHTSVFVGSLPEENAAPEHSLQLANSSHHTEISEPVNDELLSTKQKTTLLCMIAALARECHIDLSRHLPIASDPASCSSADRYRHPPVALTGTMRLVK